MTIDHVFLSLKVESYHVKYHNIGHEDDHMEATISISDLQEGKIVLDDFPATVEDGMKVEGRVKYLGFDSWSPWISSQNQVYRIYSRTTKNLT